MGLLPELIISIAGIIAGALMAWHYPQPTWVKVLIAFIKTKFKK